MNSLLKVGAHVSIAGSIDKAFDRAKNKKCNTFQIFTKNPRGWKAKELSEKEIKEFHLKAKNYAIDPVVAHIAYLPNLAAQDESMYKKSIKSFKIEIERCKILGVPYLVIHSGSYKGGSFEEGFNTYVNSIMKGIEFAEGNVQILIENTGGEKNSITDKFENIERVLNEIGDSKSIGTCFDTCHGFVAGYDMRDERKVNYTVEAIENTFGVNSIKVIHANDAKGELGSNLDRHEHVGLGSIGEKGFKALINHPKLKRKPWIIETPVDERRGDKKNIAYLRGLVQQ